MDNKQQEIFRKKMRICLLGEPSLMSQNKVMTLCEKFFIEGIEYGKKLNTSSLNDK